MSIARLPCGLLPLLLLSTTPSLAQRQSSPDGQPPTAVTLVTESDRVRFTTPGAALDWRLEIVDAQNNTLFDSGFVNSKELDWPMVRLDAQGLAVESGLYSYTLTIHRGASEPRVQRGQLQIERARSVYQISALSSDSTAGVIFTTDAGAAVASAPTPVTSSADPFRRSLGAFSFAPPPVVSGSGETNHLTKWLDGPNGVVTDTYVTETNGSVVIGNGAYKGNLQIYGSAASDVFGGMGPDLINGPGFSYGYAGSSFGRSAGFFNIRPDESAIAPNPSLRFMTANVERLIVTNIGNVGIGTANPSHRLQVVDSNTRNGTIQVGSADSWNSFERRMINFGDPGFAYVGEIEGDDILTLRGFAGVSVLSGILRPSSDNGTQLGTSTHRWSTVYASNGTINTSDARLKQRIRNVEDGLTAVMKLRPVSFEWKDSSDRRRHLGLIAQEVEPIIPEVVYRDTKPDAPLGLNYADLVPVVIKAIQDQQATISQLTEENARLKARLAAIEDALAHLKLPQR